MKTMLETLNEIIAAYTSDTRAVDSHGKCHYLTKTGLMCAVGRCMIDPGETPPDPNSVYVLAHKGLLEGLLKSEYRGFPISFWVALQCLHDLRVNWTSDGLSKRGVWVVNQIVTTHNLEETQRENS